MGCLIFASIGLFIGLFIAVASGSPANPWIGLTIIAICAIPWVRFFMARSSNQPLSQRQEQLLQEQLGELSQPPPPQSQPEQSRSPGLTATQGGLFIPQSDETKE